MATRDASHSDRDLSPSPAPQAAQHQALKLPASLPRCRRLLPAVSATVILKTRMALLVNGEYVDDEVIREERHLIYRRLREEFPQESDTVVTARAREWAEENVIERVLFQQAARTHHPDGETSGEQTESLLRSLGDRVPKPTRREVSDFYGKNTGRFAVPERARASHIVKNIDERTTEQEAHNAIETARQRLMAGQPFSEIADELSDCPGRGGDLGWFARGEMVEEFETVIFALRPGRVSLPFRSPFGFHLAQLHERKPAGTKPLPEVYHEIETALLEQRRQAKVEGYLDELRRAAQIERVASQIHEPRV